MLGLSPNSPAHKAVIEDNFSRTVEFIRVYRLLINAAEQRKMIDYKDVARAMKLMTYGYHMGNQTGQILGEISKRESECNRPLLSVLCVGSQSRVPGPGFYGLAILLGRLPEDASKEQKTAFWKAERDRVYEAWKL